MSHINNRYHETLFLGDHTMVDGKMSGTYLVGKTGLVASYSCYEQRLGLTPRVRGTVSIRSEDGSVAKLASGAKKRDRKKAREKRSEARRIGKENRTKETAEQEAATVLERPDDAMVERKPHADMFAISRRVSAASTNAEECRKKIADIAWALYFENERQLSGGSAQQYQRTEEMCFSTVVTRYGQEYLNQASKSASGQDKKRRRLNKTAELLDTTPIGKISSRQLKTLCDGVGKNWPEYFKDASGLLGYVLEKQRDGSADPFGIFLGRNAPRKQKDAAALQAEATRQRTLTAAQNETLHTLILAHPENGALIGVALVRWAGLSSKDACTLKMSAIRSMAEAPEMMYIDYHIEENAGATHDYSFPALPQLTEIINVRRAYLAEQGVDEDGLTAAASVGDPRKRLDAKDLTRLCRDLTRELGVERGAGVALLQESYRQDLLNCGFWQDSGAFKFLCHESLTNLVQADSYRCFTDETAHDFLATMLMRTNPRTKLATKSTQVQVERLGETTRTIVSPLTNKETVTMSGRVKFKKGQTMTIRTEHGVVVDVKTTDTGGKR